MLAGVVVTVALGDTEEAASNAVKLKKHSTPTRKGSRPKQHSTLLPGVIETVSSFPFNITGKAFGFLAKNIWLTFVAVIVFVMEYMTRRR